MGGFGLLAGRSLRGRLLVVLGIVLAMLSPMLAMSPAQAAVTTPGGLTSLAPSGLSASSTGVGAVVARDAAGLL